MRNPPTSGELTSGFVPMEKPFFVGLIPLYGIMGELSRGL